MKIKRNSRPHQLLKNLAVGSGIVILSLTSPASGAKIIQGVIQSYIRKKRFERMVFLRDLKNLQTRKLIDYREMDNGRIEIKLTKLGREIVLKYDIDKIKLKPLIKWDRKWRLIMFDIPHSFKNARDAFRQKLKNLKFYQLQKSVFITPYPCENEIDFIATIFNIRRHVLVLYVSHFEGDQKIKHYFRI